MVMTSRQPAGSMTERATTNLSDGNWVKIIYALYLGGLLSFFAFIFLLGPVVGLVMAYIFKGDNPGWVDSHYRYQVRTFWIGVLLSVIAAFLSLILFAGAFGTMSGVSSLAAVGASGILFLVVGFWWLLRCVFGLRYVIRGAPYP